MPPSIQTPNFPKKRQRRPKLGKYAAPHPVPNIVFPAKNGVALYASSKKPGPKYWRNIVSTLYPAPLPYSSILDNWVMILEACKIPHRVIPERRCPRLYVPPTYEKKALQEIRAVVQEKKPVMLKVPTDVNSVKGVLIFLFLLLVFHGLKMGWYGFGLPGLSSGASWPDAYGLDVNRVLNFNEWWRTITALTIHSDNAHYVSNAAFSLVFLIPLCRRAGTGLGLLMTVCAGIAGNFLNVRLHLPGVVSIGFSTALFGCVGAICSVATVDIARHMFRRQKTPFKFSRLFYPLAAGVALLGLLGGAGEIKVDYMAHACGFVAGLLTGLVLMIPDAILRRLPEATSQTAQFALYVLSIVILAFPWFIF